MSKFRPITNAEIFADDSLLDWTSHFDALARLIRGTARAPTSGAALLVGEIESVFPFLSP